MRQLGIRSVVVALATALVVTLPLGAPAHAEEATPHADAIVSVYQLTSGELAAVNETTGETAVVGQDGSVTQRDIDESTIDSTVVRRCGVLWGWPWLGVPYCDLTTLGQQMVAAGSLTLVVTSICVLSAGMCVVASPIAAAAGVYVAQNGICSGGRDLRIIYTKGGYYSFHCL